jgi:formyltetrahydrofolate deformylase
VPEIRSPSDRATLLVTCDDCPGLVASLAQALYGQGANILDADQHTDPVAGKFFQRIHFQDPELCGPDPDAAARRLESTVRAVAARFGMRWRLQYARQTKRVALFVSNTDHCLYDLLLRQRAGELRGEIALIVSNHETLRPVAEQFGVPYHCFPITAASKAAVEAEELALLREQRIDLVVLARYMQILSAGFIASFEARIINIHHSFLPAFAGGKPYHQAARRGVKLIGATAHYATTDLDEGPIVEQDVIRVSHRDTVDDLVAKGRDVERTVLSRAVRWHLEDRILVYDNKTVVFAG